ncbi:MAG: PUR family DNA/RNA-binding protein [Bacteroides sp.]|nr:PUR family DNA/RNA-binding protein [Bacteroides sp.]
MEDLKKKNEAEMSEKDIVYSKAIKAGKRIYYIDVKKSRKDDMFLAITESKKIVTGEGESAKVNFEKHKIFLYKEDFEKFLNELQNAIGYVESVQGNYNRNYTTEQKVADENNDEPLTTDGEIKIDIDF